VTVRGFPALGTAIGSRQLVGEVLSSDVED
jgi:hypothetical protein